MKKGYRPAVCESSDIKCLVEDLGAWKELGSEILERIDSLPRRHVTATELKRDFGFTDSSLRFLERSGWLSPTCSRRKRKAYDLLRALRMAAKLPGIVSIERVRTRRKHTNIVTVQHEVLARIAAGPSN